MATIQQSQDISMNAYHLAYSEDSQNQEQKSSPRAKPVVQKQRFSSSAGASLVYLGQKKKKRGEQSYRDWNEEFQQLIGQTFTDNSLELERTKNLRSLCDEFGLLAAQIGKIIISELFVDLSQRKIPPITARVGGVAGGEKFFYEGIFFKLPVDEFEIYDGYEGVMKCAGHELRGLKSLIDCRIQSLHFPLMILCDYRGYRLLAGSLLPLGKDTLVYGSSDGGRTIHNANQDMNEKLELLSKMLNLQGEYVWNHGKTHKTYLHLSSDIEGHIGKDGRSYLVDFARLWPPTTPRPGVKGDFLRAQMRPELVKSNPLPLNPDSFSGFGLENKQKHNEEVREATRRLENQIIPEFASKLESTFPNINNPSIYNSKKMITLISDLHGHGINIRYLGYLRQHIKCIELRKFILTEIIARVIKGYVRSEMRKLRSSEESDYINLLVENLNNTFGSSHESLEFWKVTIAPSINQRFENALSQDEIAILNDGNINDTSAPFLQLHWTVLISRLKHMLGFNVSDNYVGQLSDERFINFPAKLLFESSHIKELYPIVKQVHRISFEEGTALSRAAIHERSDDLFAQAAEKYKESLRLKPNDIRSLNNWGLSLMMQGVGKVKTKDLVEADTLFKSAQEKFQKALSIVQNDYRTLNQLGICLTHQATMYPTDLDRNLPLLDNACEAYQRANQLQTSDYEILYNWGNTILLLAKIYSQSFDKYIDLLTQACSKYALAHENKSDSYEILRNWAVTLSKLARCKTGDESHNLFQFAYEKYDAAVKLRANDHEIYFNWANALYHQAYHYSDTFMCRKTLAASGDQYCHSLKLKNDYLSSLNNWTRVLVQLASFDIPDVSMDDILPNQVEKYLGILKTFPYGKDLSSLPNELVTLINFTHQHMQSSTHLISVLKELASSDPSLKRTQSEQMVEDNLLRSSTNISRNNRGLLLSLSEKLQSIMLLEKRKGQEFLKETDFEFLEIVGGGKGSFATVYRARKRSFAEISRIFAIKVIKKDIVQPTNQPIQHPYIVELLNLFHDEKRAYFVYEFYTGKQLIDCWKEKKKIPEDRARFYTAELILAIEHIHQLGIIYRTLSPSKLLLDSYGHIKLIPKLEINNDSSTQLESLAVEFMAPELLEGADDTSAVDWWSIGVILFQFLTGKTPFDAPQFNKIIEKVMMGNVIYPPDLSAQARNLLTVLLNVDPQQRLQDAKNIKSHPFYNGIDWKLLLQRKIEPPYKPQDDKLYRVVFPEAEMSDTVVMPNFSSNFMGYTYASPSLTKKM